MYRHTHTQTEMRTHTNTSYALLSSTLQSELLIEPRYPLFGGWKATFIVGYGVPVQDFLFGSADGARYLNYSFGCPLTETVVDKLTIKVCRVHGSYFWLEKDICFHYCGS